MLSKPAIGVERSFIIPAIDIIDGKCVRLIKGDFSAKTIYNDNPLDTAMTFQEAGFTRLHLVDLDGARSGSVKNLHVLEKIASKTQLEIDFGGGLKKEEDVRTIFSSGAKWATVGSVAVERPEEFGNWLSKFGANRFLLGADVKGEKIAIKGWQEVSGMSVFDLIESYSKKEIRQVFCTDISKDGMLEGPSLELYKEIIRRLPEIKLIASGGVSSMEDLRLLKEAGCTAAIVGKALYEGRIKISQLL